VLDLASGDGGAERIERYLPRLRMLANELPAPAFVTRCPCESRISAIPPEAGAAVVSASNRTINVRRITRGWLHRPVVMALRFAAGAGLLPGGRLTATETLEAS